MYLKKLRGYYIWECFILIGWLINFILFSNFYKEAFFYVDKKSEYLIQLIFMVENYVDGVLVFLFSSFLLMIINLFLILMFHIKVKQMKLNEKNEKKINFFSIFLLVMLGINVVLLLKPVLWSLFLIIFILATVVVFATYSINNFFYDETDVVYEENEIIQSGGPFRTEEEAQKHLDEFVSYWSDDFRKRGYHLVCKKTQFSGEKWYTEIEIQSN